MRRRGVGAAQREEHAVGRGDDVGVRVVVEGQLCDGAGGLDPEHRSAAVLIRGDDQRRSVPRPRHRRRPAIPVGCHVDTITAEAQAAQCDSRCSLRRRIGLADIGDRRTVRRDHRAPQVGVWFVGDDGPLAAVGVDAHEYRVLRRAGRRLLPAGHHESTVGTDIEVRVPQRTCGRRGEVRGFVTGQSDTQQMRV